MTLGFFIEGLCIFMLFTLFFLFFYFFFIFKTEF